MIHAPWEHDEKYVRLIFGPNSIMPSALGHNFSVLTLAPVNICTVFRSQLADLCYCLSLLMIQQCILCNTLFGCIHTLSTEFVFGL